MPWHNCTLDGFVAHNEPILIPWMGDANIGHNAWLDVAIQQNFCALVDVWDEPGLMPLLHHDPCDLGLLAIRRRQCIDQRLNLLTLALALSTSTHLVLALLLIL